MRARNRWSGTQSPALFSALCSGLFLIALVACSPQSTTAVASQQAAADPLSDGAENVK
jgi:hypothetical protein